MTYYVDGIEAGANPHVNYEPRAAAACARRRRAGKRHTPYVAGHVVRQKISRTNDFEQAGERYRTIEQWERDDLITNLVAALKQCSATSRSAWSTFHPCDPTTAPASPKAWAAASGSCRRAPRRTGQQSSSER